MSASPLPVDANRSDWPRLAAQRVNSLLTRVAKIEATPATSGGTTLLLDGGTAASGSTGAIIVDGGSA